MFRIYSLKILFFLIVFGIISAPSVVFAQNATVQSQMLNTSITVSDTTGYTVTGNVKLSNNSTKGFDKVTLVIKLLQLSKPVETNFNGQKSSYTPAPQIIDFQKSEPLSLAPTQVYDHSFSMKYPALINSGNYQLVAELLDQDSTSQSIATQPIALNGNGGFLEIDQQSCKVVVGSNTFNNTAGATIKNNQTGIASCVVKNPNAKPVSARIVVSYAVFSVMGSNASQSGDLDVPSELISFAANDQKTVQFNLPSNLTPNVYEGLFGLTDQSGQKISPKVQFRWIVSGASANISNLDLDKTYYKKDEVAHIKATILPSGDMGWRSGSKDGAFSPTAGTDLTDAKAVIKISDDKGEICGEKTENLPSTKDKPWSEFNFDVSVTKDCMNPKVDFQVVVGADNRVLAAISKANTSTDSDLKAGGITPVKIASKNPNIIAIVAIIVIIIIAVAAFLIIRRRRKGQPPVDPPAGTPTPPSVPSPTTPIVTGILLFLIAGSLFATTKLELNFSPGIAEVNAQNADIVKQPINSTDATTKNVSMQQGPGREKMSYYTPVSNVRDFAQNNTGGDSQVSVAPDCTKIDVTLNASASSGNSCGNWGIGAPVQVYIDGQPVAVENVQSLTDGAHKYQPTPGTSASNTYDTLVLGRGSGPLVSKFSLSPPQANTTGQHTLTVRVGTSYLVDDDSDPGGGSIDDYHNTYEDNNNCDGKGPCYVELKRVFDCKGPVACNEPCSTKNDCSSNKEGCSECRDNGSGQKTCQKPPSCNASCATQEDCSSNKEGCTVCRPNTTGENTCQQPPLACNAACSADKDCFGNKEGCTSCVEGACKPPPACGTACTTDQGCTAAKDGCTACVSGTCRIPPACGTACTTKADCAGAKDGCSECLEGTCTDFSETMCKCDGFEATKLEYPSSEPFSFNAFAKVEGKDIRKAMVEGMQFKLSESDKNTPNAGTIIAQSPMYTPEIVSSDSGKVRFKATWNLTPPEIKANKIYRVFSEIKCKPKKILNTPTADASDPNQYQSKVAGVSTVNAAEGDVVARNDLQLRSLNFIKKGQTDNCRFLFFEIDPGQ